MQKNQNEDMAAFFLVPKMYTQKEPNRDTDGDGYHRAFNFTVKPIT